MSNWLWVCPGFPSIWKFSWIKTWTRHLSFSLSNWLKTSLKEWLKRCSVPVWSSSDSLWADLSRAQGAGGWPMNGILAAFLRHIWTIVELENLGLMDWKPWIPRFADSSRFPLDFMICSVRQNVFFFFLEAFDMTWLVPAMTGLQLQTPEPCWSHILSVLKPWQSRNALLLPFSWSDWEGNQTHLRASMLGWHCIIFLRGAQKTWEESSKNFTRCWGFWYGIWAHQPIPAIGQTISVSGPQGDWLGCSPTRKIHVSYVPV